MSDRSAPYADFGHGSLFKGAPGARQFGGATELSARFLVKPFLIRMQHGGLLAYKERFEAIPSGEASDHAKPPARGSDRDFERPFHTKPHTGGPEGTLGRIKTAQGHTQNLR